MATNDVGVLASRLDDARSVTVITGAGVSAPSGVPTFRGDHGLWKNHRPEELATPQAFASNPKMIWEWYNWRREVVAQCQPNAAHHILAKWASSARVTTIITQNVDGLHERAGTDALIRFHGSIWELRCWKECDAGKIAWLDSAVPLHPLPPRCPYCNELARPGVVWFGEHITPDVLSASVHAAHCEVFLTIGTSAIVQPAASLVHTAKQGGAFTAEINLEPTPSSTEVDIAIQGSADHILAKIERQRDY